jgi:hypothetical protein
MRCVFILHDGYDAGLQVFWNSATLYIERTGMAHYFLGIYTEAI